jgi:hypothetical protein
MNEARALSHDVRLLKAKLLMNQISSEEFLTQVQIYREKNKMLNERSRTLIEYDKCVNTIEPKNN